MLNIRASLQRARDLVILPLFGREMQREKYKSGYD